MPLPSQASRAVRRACWWVWALSFGAWPLPAATYYVATNGLDGNSGSLGAPWATISHATSILAAGDTVLIRGGTYRETVTIGNSGSSGNLITYQAYPGEVPVISGANVFTNWTWDTSATPSAWTIPWTTNLASTSDSHFALANATALRPEMVIFNGQVLWAVGTRAALTNGSFFVNGPSTSPTAIYAIFPNNASPAGNTVEIATRTHALVDNKAYVVINGLTFRYACNVCQDLMVQMNSGAQHVLFENNTVEWANAGGVYAAGGNNVFSNNLVRCNGQMGFSGAGSSQLWVNNQSISNNWKLYNPGWEAGGGKWVHTYASTIRGHQAAYNKGIGIWFDVTNNAVLVEQCFICSNSVAGILLELHSVGCTVRNNVICGTQLFPGYEYGSGITMLDSMSNNIINNTIYGCAADGLWLYSDTRVTNASGENNIFNNIIAFNEQAGLTSWGNGYQIFIDGQTSAEALSNTLDGNVFWRGSSPGTTFYLSGSGTDSLGTWKSWTGGDTNSVQQDPLLSNSSLPTGFNLTAGSPARSLGVTPPVSVTNDFLGNSRPATGADAGAVQYIPSPLSFSRQPLPLQRFVGGNAFFSATVTSNAPASLQWCLNSLPIAGATNSTLVLSNLTSAQAGSYTLVASNATSAATSLPAQLSVWTPDAYAAAVLATAPAAYWRLNESNGPTVFDCLATNNGTASAAVIFAVTGAIPNDPDTACHFDASNSDKADVGYNPTFNASAFSFECWARVTVATNIASCPLASRSAPTTQGYFVQVSSNNVWQFCSGTGINNLWHTQSGPPAVLGQWTHLAGTYSGTSKIFYVNGQQVASNNVAFVPNASAPLRFGAGATEGPGSDFFNGEVDEVAIYGHALSAAQMQTHYQTAFLPLSFSRHPLPLQRFVGGNAFFSATVTSNAPASLQWCLNSLPIAGATNSTLVLSNLTSAQAGSYTLVASNATSAATSLPAQLSVWTPDAYAAAVLATAPAAYWRLNESNGPTVFDCLATNNGTASAAVIFAVTGAIPNDPDTACHFDASNSDKADVGYNPTFNASAFSFECWARVTVATNIASCPLASRSAPTTQGYFVQVSSNNVWQFCSGTGINNLWHTQSGPPAVLGQWTHLAGTYSGTSKIFYVNGQQVASNNVAFVPNASAPLRFGAGATEGPGSDFFNGEVDEVAVYGYALSAAQVQTHYQAAFLPETLSIASTNGGVQVTWLGGTLQTAASPTGPWTVVTNAVPPWVFAPATNQQFFRIRIP